MKKILEINQALFVPMDEIELTAIRSGGPGGQHVNKVSTAVRLRFRILDSTLPEEVKVQLILSGDNRISKKGVFSIKANESRSQAKNKELALKRFCDFIEGATRKQKKRIPTKLSKKVKAKRKEDKKRKSDKKQSRRKRDF